MLPAPTDVRAAVFRTPTPPRPGHSREGQQGARRCRQPCGRGASRPCLPLVEFDTAVRDHEPALRETLGGGLTAVAVAAHVEVADLPVAAISSTATRSSQTFVPLGSARSSGSLRQWARAGVLVDVHSVAFVGWWCSRRRSPATPTGSRNRSTNGAQENPLRGWKRQTDGGENRARHDAPATDEGARTMQMPPSACGSGHSTLFAGGAQSDRDAREEPVPSTV
jgi:hypothetical protein